MFSHVVVGADDVTSAKTFYDAIMGALGINAVLADQTRVMYQHGAASFIATRPINGQPATAANGGTIGFTCNSPDQVDVWHEAGVCSGGQTCEDPPGVREVGGAKFYMAYLRDPSGNKLCAYCSV